MYVSVHTNDFYGFFTRKIRKNTCWGDHPKPADFGTVCLELLVAEWNADAFHSL